MIGYRDTTFCASEVTEHTCGREFTQQDAINAEKWWGGIDYPVAYGEFCEEAELLTSKKACDKLNNMKERKEDGEHRNTAN